MEKIKGFSIELSLDSLKVDSGLKDLKSSMRLMNSEMRNNMSSFDRGEKSLKKYETQLGGLNKKLEVQRTVTESARKHYEKMVAEHGEGSKQAQEAAAAYNNESAQLSNLERHIGKVTQEMQSFKREQEIQSSGWYKTGEALESFGTKLGDVSQRAREVGGTLTKRITLPVLGITTAVGGMVAAFGWGRLTGLDSAQAQLRGLGYNTEEVGRISDQVTNAIEGGMTTMAEGTAVAAGAMAAGVEEGKDLERYIKLVGDAAVGANRPVDEMAQIFNKVQGQGKLMTRELNQIELSMPGFAQSMADNLGVSQEEFREMVTAGEISSKEFLDVMDDFAGGMAEAYADSWKGMVMNTKAYIGIIGENLLGGVFEKSKESIAEFIEMLKSDSVQKWAEETGETLGNAFSSFVDNIKNVIYWYKDLSVKQQKFILGIGGFIVALGPLLTGLGVLGGIISKISLGLGEFFKFLAPIMIPLKGVGKSASDAGKSVGVLGRAFTFLTGPTGIVISLFTLLYTTSQTFRKAIYDTIKSITDFGKGVYSYLNPAIDTVIDSFKVMLESFEGTGGSLDSLGAAFAPLLDIIGLLAKTIIGTLAVAFTLIMPIISGVTRTIGPLTKVISNLISIVVNLGMTILSVFMLDFSKAMDHFKTAFRSALDVFKNLWDAFYGFFEGVITTLLAQLGILFGGWDNLEAISKKVWNGIIALFGKVKESFANLVDSLNIQPIKDFFLSVGDTAKQAGSDISKSLLEGITQSFNDAVESARGLFYNVGEKISESISAGLNTKVGELVKGYFSSVRESMKSAGGIATMIAPSLIGIGSRLLGLTGPVGVVISIVSSLISTFIRLYRTNEGFHDFIHKTWDDIKEVFSSFWQSLEPIFDGFREVFGEIAKELGPEFAETKDVILDSVNELRPTFEELGASFSELGKTFVELFGNIIKAAGNLVKEFVPILVNFHLTIFKTVGEIAMQILPLLLKAFKAVFSAILSVVQAVIPIIVKVFAALINVVVEIAKFVIPLILSVVKAILPAVLSIVETVIPAIVSIITLLIDVVMELVKAVLPLIATVVKTVFSVVLTIISTVLPIVVELLTTVIDVILNLVKAVIPLILSVVQAVFPIVQNIIEVATKIITTALKLLVGVIQNVVVPAIKFILQVVQIVFPVITKVIEGALNIIIGILDFFVALFKGNWSGMWDAIKSILNSAVSIIWSVIKGAFDLIALFIENIFTWISRFFSMIWSVITATFKTVISAIYNYVVNRFTAIKNTTTTIFTAIWNFLRNIWNTVLEFIINIILTLYNRFVNGWKNIYNSTKTVFSNVWNFLRDIWNRIKKFISDSVSNIFNKVSDTWGNLKNRTTEMFGDIYKAIKNKFDDIVSAAKNLPGRIGDGIKSTKDKAIDAMKGVGDSLMKAAGKPFNKVLDGVGWITRKLGVTFDAKKHHWKYPGYARGTKGAHPGGLAMVNDGRGRLSGRELISFPDGSTGMFKGKDVVANLPKGTHVFSAPDTRSLLSGMPQYNRGTDSTQGFINRGSNVTGGKARKRTWSEKIWDYVKKPKKILDIALDKMGAKLPKNTSMFKDMLKGGFSKIKDSAVDKVKSLFKENEHNNPNLMVGGKPSFGFPITSHFGMRTHPVYGTKKLHTGTDFGAPAGTPIPSQTGGTVSFAGWGGGYGNLVKVKNGIWEMYYAHMSKILASVGQKVTRGTKLGLVGSTGTSTAAHLHYEVRKNGKPLDPMKVSPSGAVGSGVQRWAGTATKALKMTGSYSASNLQKLLYQMKTESNGNPRAINNWDINAKRGTPSKGLMQVIDPTFAAYKMPGHNNIWNPLDNILASIRYALSRYGSLSRAYRGVGYEQGTNYVPENQWAYLHKGEAVIPEKYNQQPKKTDAMKLLALVAKKIGADGGSKRTRNNHDVNNRNSEEISLLKQQVQLLTELVISNRNIEKKPVVSEGDIKRSYDKLDSKQSRNHDIFTGKPGGVY